MQYGSDQTLQKCHCGGVEVLWKAACKDPEQNLWFS